MIFNYPLYFIIINKIKLNFKMNYQSSVIPENASIRAQLKGSVVHQFDKKKKQKIAEGPCELYETNDSVTPGSSCYLKVGSFIDEIKQPKKLIRINYPENTSYLFWKENESVCSISFHKNTQNLDKFQKIINRYVPIADFASGNAQDEFMQRIKENCPDNIQTKDITSDGRSLFKKVGKNIGLAMGMVNNIVSKPASSASQILSERANRISRDSISEQTKTKWNNFKQKSDQINQALANLLRPAVTKFNNISDSIGEAFYSSNNAVIKNVREYSLAFSTSVNDAEKAARTGEAQPKLSEEQQSNYELK